MDSQLALNPTPRQTDMTTAAHLQALADLNPTWTFVDTGEAHFTLTARLADQPQTQVTLIATNSFAALCKGYESLKTLLKGKRILFRVVYINAGHQYPLEETTH